MRGGRRALSRCLVACLIAVALGVGWTGVARADDRTVLMSEDEPAEEDGKRSRNSELMTERDDARAGQEGAQAVAAQIGLLGDAELDAYVEAIGQKLLRGLPRRSFRYHFYVVDQTEPNAFALPGGYIFISRGLLALVETEDELANVIGHEITHASMRHSARQQAMARHMNPLVMGWRRQAQMSSYGRDMEREADRRGQQLAAAAGYDPRGMGTFMETLRLWERAATGKTREPSFFDTHPTSNERAVVNSVRASEMRWTRDASLGDTRSSHLRRVEGIPVGQRPESGIFEEERFLHPDLDFQIRFPDGWHTVNTNSAVGAQSPRGSAVVFLSADTPPGGPEKSAQAFLRANSDLKVSDSQPVKIRGAAGWKVDGVVSGRGGRAAVSLLFIQHGGVTWLFTGMSPGGPRYERHITSTMRSFRTLTPSQRQSLRATRLHIVKAQAGEDLSSLSSRTGNTWDRERTAVANGFKRDLRFEGGELVKIARSEPYTSPGR